MNRRLVLVRHGRTAWNAQRRGQGHTDVPLDAVGEAEAAAAAPWLASFEPSVVWSSDLTRALVTATRAAERLGLGVRVDERLREFNLGERAGLTMEDYRERFPEEYQQFLRGDFRDVPGAEQVADVTKRMCDVLGEVVADLSAGETALIASHGSAIKTAVLGMTGQPVALKTLGGLPNCAVAILNESAAAPAGWSLAAYGLTAPAR